MTSVPTEKGKTMIAYDVKKALAMCYKQGLSKELLRGVPEEMLYNIALKISYYKAAVDALRERNGNG